jgi:hypothetical protein
MVTIILTIYINFIGKSIQAPKIIFAQRNKRQESSLFKLGYFSINIFFIFDGTKDKFWKLHTKKTSWRSVNQSNIWNHYSGGISQRSL